MGRIYPSPSIATSAVKKSETLSWKIEHECPQCGGPVTLEETDRLFSCAYCRVRLYLLSRDYFRYSLPASESFSRDILFVPYWRFKGTVFFCTANGIKHTFNDVSSLASLPRIPAELPRFQTANLEAEVSFR